MVVKIGHKIRTFRLDAGLTQAQLAKMLKKNQAYVANLERDYRSISLNTLERIAKALKKKMRDFF